MRVSKLHSAACLLFALAAGGCLQPSAQGGPPKLELSALEISELDGNGDDAPNRGETLYLKPVFKNTGGATAGEFTVRLVVAAPGSVHFNGLGSDKLTIAPIAAGATNAEQSNFRLGLKLDKAASPDTELPLTLQTTHADGRTETFETRLKVLPIANAFTLAGTAIAEASGDGDGQADPGEVIYLKPRFTNTGAAKTNQLTVIVAAEGDGSPYAGGDAATFISIGALEPGGTSKEPAQAFLGLRVASSASAGASIPLTYTLKDPFGNVWTVQDSLTLP